MTESTAGRAAKPWRAARLFDELCDEELPERRRRLAELERDEPALAAEIARLLAADGRAEGPIERLQGELAAAAERRLLAGPGEAQPARAPERLGVWRLAELLGRGGMGEVWRGERSEGGFAQQAAIKIVRAGMASDGVIERFRLERQVLARLDHPAIAKVLDGGLAPDGRPWFAMELVAGLPITEFARLRALPVRAKVELLIAVAEAVDVAHRSLVVHRDLKPSNVLVTEEGKPKLLDFGLVKLLEPELDPRLTRTEMRALTPSHAAPEQVLGEPVTTATDVYALGVLLFELLTGELPHRRAATTPAGLAEEASRETVERPSLRIERSGGRDRLPKRLAGDLDTIVLKALARDPRRRYATAAAFADDLARLLASRPILARPDSLGYRSHRFVRRHRAAVAGAALALTSLALGLAATLHQARAARLEASRTARVRDFLASIFESANPDLAGGRDASAAELVAAGVARIESELAGEPAIAAELYAAIGRTLLSLERFDEAAALAERSRRLAAQTPQSGPELAARGDLLAGEIDTAIQELVAGEARIRRAATMLGNEEGDDAALERSRAGAALARNLNAQGRSREALDWAERAHRELAARLGPGHRETVRALVEVSRALRATDGAAEAGRRVDAVLAEVGNGAGGGAHPVTRALLEIERGQVAIYLRRPAEAERAAHEALARLEAAGGPGTASAASARQVLALSDLQRGDFAAAEDELDAAIALYGDGARWSPQLVSLKLDLALVREHAGRMDEGIALRRELLAATIADLGPASTAARTQRSYLGSALVRAERPDEAAVELRRVVDDAPPGPAGELDMSRRSALFSLVELELAQGRLEAAQATARRHLDAVVAGAELLPAYELAASRLLTARVELAIATPESLRRARREVDAVSARPARSAHEGSLRTTILARIDLAEGHLPAAQRGFESALAELESQGKSSSAEAGEVWLDLGSTLAAAGDRAGARAAFERAYDTLFRRRGSTHALTARARRALTELDAAAPGVRPG